MNFNVGSADALYSALKSAHAGDTISLATGSYGNFSAYALNFAGNVTVLSADALHPALFTGLTVSSSSGLTFANIEFAVSSGSGVYIQQSNHVVLTGLNLHGATTTTGVGVTLRDSSDITIANSRVHDLGVGVTYIGGKNVAILANTFHHNPSGDLTGGGVTNLVVSGNLHDGGFIDGLPTTSPTSPTQPIPTSPTPTSPTPTAPTSGPVTFQVSTTDGLVTALKSAHGGDTILLAGGTYSALSLSGFKFSSMVTVKSADLLNKASFSGLSLSNDSNLTFSNLDVNLKNGDSGVVYTSSHIRLDALTIHGSPTTFGGNGVFVRSSDDVTVSNSKFSEVGTGVIHLDTTGLKVVSNTFTNIQSDGVLGGNANHALVSGNTFSNFHPKLGDHPDAIQFWGAVGSKPTDITITNNIIIRGAGAPIQGIFLEDVDHVTISGNAMVGTMYNGISLDGVSAAAVKNNFVQGYLDMATRIITRGASSDVTVTGNTTQAVVDFQDIGPNPRYLASGNTIVLPTVVGDTSKLLAWVKALSGSSLTADGGGLIDLTQFTLPATDQAGHEVSLIPADGQLLGSVTPQDSTGVSPLADGLSLDTGLDAMDLSTLRVGASLWGTML